MARFVCPSLSFVVPDGWHDVSALLWREPPSDESVPASIALTKRRVGPRASLSELVEERLAKRARRLGFHVARREKRSLEGVALEDTFTTWHDMRGELGQHTVSLVKGGHVYHVDFTARATRKPGMFEGVLGTLKPAARWVPAPGGYDDGQVSFSLPKRWLDLGVIAVAAPNEDGTAGDARFAITRVERHGDEVLGQTFAREVARLGESLPEAEFGTPQRVTFRGVPAMNVACVWTSPRGKIAARLTTFLANGRAWSFCGSAPKAEVGRHVALFDEMAGSLTLSA